MGKAAKKMRGISWHVTITLLILMCVIMWWRGYDFYPLSLDDRVTHSEYRQLRSSGHIGYGYGVAGTLLVFANLLYLARRRFARWNFGSMKTWLDLHVFTGLTGAVFISFHSAFKARSLMAQVTSLSLIVVVITGLLGRFLYALIPSTKDAKLKDAVAEADALVPGLGAQVETLLKENTPVRLRTGSLFRALGKLRGWRRTARDRHEGIGIIIGNAAQGLEPDRAKQLSSVRRRVQREAVGEVRAVAASAILRTWRNLHLFFAILMLLTVVFHIAVAWYYGFRWFWSE